MSKLKIVGRTEPEEPSPPPQILHGVCKKCGVVVEGLETEWSIIPSSAAVMLFGTPYSAECPECDRMIYAKDGPALDHLRNEPQNPTP